MRDSVSSIEHTHTNGTSSSTATKAWELTATKSGYYPIGFMFYHSHSAAWACGVENVEWSLGKLKVSGFHASTNGNNHGLDLDVTWIKAL